jgi:hypothetical protein
LFPFYEGHWDFIIMIEESGIIHVNELSLVCHVYMFLYHKKLVH